MKEEVNLPEVFKSSKNTNPGIVDQYIDSAKFFSSFINYLL